MDMVAEILVSWLSTDGSRRIITSPISSVHSRRAFTHSFAHLDTVPNSRHLISSLWQVEHVGLSVYSVYFFYNAKIKHVSDNSTVPWKWEWHCSFCCTLFCWFLGVGGIFSWINLEPERKTNNNCIFLCQVVEFLTAKDKIFNNRKTRLLSEILVVYHRYGKGVPTYLFLSR